MSKKEDKAFEDRRKRLTERAEQYKKEKQDLLDKADNRLKEFEEMDFVLTKSAKVAKAIKDFLSNDAEWTFQEGFYLNQLIETFPKPEKSEDDGVEFKVKNRFLDTINYFLSKVKGNGTKLHNANLSFQNYLIIFDVVQGALAKTNEIRQEIEKIQNEIKEVEYKLQSVNHGIDPDEDVEAHQQEIEQYQETLLSEAV